jgi:hypothetical protein
MSLQAPAPRKFQIFNYNPTSSNNMFPRALQHQFLRSFFSSPFFVADHDEIFFCLSQQGRPQGDLWQLQGDRQVVSY